MVLDKLLTRAVRKTISLMISRLLTRKKLDLAAQDPELMISVPQVLVLVTVTTEVAITLVALE